MKDFIIKKVFDIRPVTKSGEIDFDHIYRIKKTLDLKKEVYFSRVKITRKQIPVNKKTISTIRFRQDNKSLTSTENSIDVLKELRSVFYDLEQKEKQIKTRLEKMKLDKLETLLDSKIVTKSVPPPSFLLESTPLAATKAPSNHYKTKTDHSTKLETRSSHFIIINKAFVFAAITLFLLINFSFFGLKAHLNKETIALETIRGFQNLYKAQASFNNLSIENFLQSKQYLESAYENFLNASQELEGLGKEILKVLAFISPNEILKTGYYTVYLGKDLSQAGKTVVQAFDLLAQINIASFFDPRQDSKDSNNQILTPAKIISGVGYYLIETQKYLTSAQNNLNKISLDVIPVEFRKDFLKLKEKLPETRKNVEIMASNFDIFGELMGLNEPKNYLVLFQNNSEIRATGGFIGSYALAKVKSARIEELKVDDIYNIDGQITANIIPPNPIKKISTAWSTHDANWFLDFPSSAKKIAWFFEKTGSPTPDVIIALTPEFIEDILKITGPIEIEEENFIVEHHNFLELLQYKVEDLDKKTGNPKRILGKLTQKLLTRLARLDNNKLKELIAAFNQNIAQKNIIFYFKNKNAQEIAETLNITGSIKPTDLDFLAIVNSNINGFKTDKVISQHINVTVNINSDNSVTNNVVVKRVHNGGDSPYDWYNKVNANYLRIYTPYGSVFVKAEGHTREKTQDPIDYFKENFKEDEDVAYSNKGLINIDGIDIFKESERTVFGSWLYVSPKEEVNYKIEYALPFKIGSDGLYSLFLQKQPGQVNNKLTVTIKYPDGFKLKEKSDNLKSAENNSLYFESSFDQDQQLFVRFE